LSDNQWLGVTAAMRITVAKLENNFPGGHHSSPHARACALAYTGRDYLQACAFLVDHHEQIGPLFNVILPTMHQALELLAKAVAYKVDPTFDPKTYSHRVRDLVQDYSASVPLFASLTGDQNTLDLLEGLEKSYLGVRYGECVLAYDFEAWTLFTTVAEALLDALSQLTGLKFLEKHWVAGSPGTPKHP
jgi:hypothetical protein